MYHLKLIEKCIAPMGSDSGDMVTSVSVEPHVHHTAEYDETIHMDDLTD